jgi:hypothetical protein
VNESQGLAVSMETDCTKVLHNVCKESVTSEINLDKKRPAGCTLTRASDFVAENGTNHCNGTRCYSASAILCLQPGDLSAITVTNGLYRDKVTECILNEI